MALKKTALKNIALKVKIFNSCGFWELKLDAACKSSSWFQVAVKTLKISKTFKISKSLRAIKR